jgi:Tfp pilus assembly protein PilO
MTAKHRTLLIAIVAAAAIAAYWFLLLTPKQEEAAKLADQISTKQGELDQAKREIATYRQAKAGYKANYVAVTRLGKAMPTDDDTRSLMVQLQAAAKRSGVDFLTIDVGSGAVAAAPAGAPAAGTFPPGVSPNANGIGELPFTFTFAGSFFELSEFLRRLERFVTVSNKRIDVTGRLLTLQSIDLLPDATAGFPTITASIKATSYLLPKEDAATGAASAAAPADGTTAAAATAAPAASTDTTTTTATAGAAG